MSAFGSYATSSTIPFIIRLCSIAALILAIVDLPASAFADTTPAAIVEDMKRVADWQIANPSQHPASDWTQAPFYLGLEKLYQVSGEGRYLNPVKQAGQLLAYGAGPRLSHADDHAVLQAWLELYALDGDRSKLQPSIDQFNKLTAVLSRDSAKSISGGSFTWCWCDALFMSPAVWVRLSKITGDPKYLDWADREWWTTTDVLYDPSAHLYYRDNNFFTKQTPTGKKVFWSRGNGWVVGGLVHVLDSLPEGYASRTKYLGLYHDMMFALLDLQNPDGLWRTSLLDHQDPHGESSGSAFFAYAMAWGINRGLLPSERFHPAVMRAYDALAKNIQPSGMLGFVQKISDGPDKQETNATSNEVYGSGAFLLAGSEIISLLDQSKQRADLAPFRQVKLPDRFLPEPPRAFARFVPERMDDFAWENDLVAFRTYGPTLRPSNENSGIDCWFKRVPYPILNKWYLQDGLKLPYGKVGKPYHHDHGEGYDVFKVGNTRGCGGLSVVVNGEFHDSETFIAHRMVENTPERIAFELDYASNLNGQVLRETKRITLIMGQHFFQSDSRFTLDGKPAANLEVAIGLAPQVKGTSPVCSPETGIMLVWETLDGQGLGTGVVMNPSRVLKMESHTDAKAQTQAFCFARTDSSGSIRWFSGFGWQGQGDFPTLGAWKTHLNQFAERFNQTPYADPTIDPNFKVHDLAVPAEATAPPTAD